MSLYSRGHKWLTFFFVSLRLGWQHMWNRLRRRNTSLSEYVGNTITNLKKKTTCQQLMLLSFTLKWRHMSRKITWVFFLSEIPVFQRGSAFTGLSTFHLIDDVHYGWSPRSLHHNEHCRYFFHCRRVAFLTIAVGVTQSLVSVDSNQANRKYFDKKEKSVFSWQIFVKPIYCKKREIPGFCKLNRKFQIVNFQPHVFHYSLIFRYYQSHRIAWIYLGKACLCKVRFVVVYCVCIRYRCANL